MNDSPKMNEETAFPCQEFSHMEAQAGSDIPMPVYINNTGMTLREYAAIHLLQPTSGLDWLDDMIRSRMRDEMAGRALNGITSSGKTPRIDGVDKRHSEGEASYILADAMMKQREEKNG